MAKIERCKVCNKKIKEDFESMYCGHGAVKVMDLDGNTKFWLCATHATFLTNNDRKASMWVEQDFIVKPAKCKTCGEEFYQNSRNQKHCDDCRQVIHEHYRENSERNRAARERKKGTKGVGKVQAE